MHVKFVCEPHTAIIGQGLIVNARIRSKWVTIALWFQESFQFFIHVTQSGLGSELFETRVVFSGVLLKLLAPDSVVLEELFLTFKLKLIEIFIIPLALIVIKIIFIFIAKRIWIILLLGFTLFASRDESRLLGWKVLESADTLLDSLERHILIYEALLQLFEVNWVRLPK